MPYAPLTFQTLVARAQQLTVEWQGETHERAGKDTFWNEFFAVFGVQRRRVAILEPWAERLSTGHHGFMDASGQPAMDKVKRSQ